MNLPYNYVFSTENGPNSNKVEKGHILPLRRKMSNAKREQL